MSSTDAPTSGDHWFCTDCGALNPLVWELGYRELKPCKACSKPSALFYVALIQAGISGGEYRPCPKCNRANSFSAYCGFCGHRF